MRNLAEKIEDCKLKYGKTLDDIAIEALEAVKKTKRPIHIVGGKAEDVNYLVGKLRHIEPFREIISEKKRNLYLKDPSNGPYFIELDLFYQ